MKHIRNFMYNNSDIFVAIGILAVSALLIAWRMDVLMNYSV